MQVPADGAPPATGQLMQRTKDGLSGVFRHAGQDAAARMGCSGATLSPAQHGSHVSAHACTAARRHAHTSNAWACRRARVAGRAARCLSALPALRPLTWPTGWRHPKSQSSPAGCPRRRSAPGQSRPAWSAVAGRREVAAGRLGRAGREQRPGVPVRRPCRGRLPPRGARQEWRGVFR